MKIKIIYFTKWVGGLLVYVFVQLFFFLLLFLLLFFFFFSGGWGVGGLLLSLVLKFLNAHRDVLWWFGLFGYRLDCWFLCFCFVLHNQFITKRKCLNSEDNILTIAPDRLNVFCLPKNTKYF